MNFSLEQALVLYVSYQVASALVQALPPPAEGERWYAFGYRFLNLLVGDFKTFISAVSAGKVPGVAEVEKKE